jgi:hypothetical protein
MAIAAGLAQSWDVGVAGAEVDGVDAGGFAVAVMGGLAAGSGVSEDGGGKRLLSQEERWGDRSGRR